MAQLWDQSGLAPEEVTFKVDVTSHCSICPPSAASAEGVLGHLAMVSQ